LFKKRARKLFRIKKDDSRVVLMSQIFSDETS